METLTAINQRRSTRKFTSEPVPRDLLEKLVHAARTAPTARDLQNLRFYVLTNKDKAGAFLGQYEAKFPHLLERKQQLKVANAVTYGAPVVIIITYPKDSEWGPMDVGFATQNILVAAEALGLGAVPVGMLRVAADAVLEFAGADPAKEAFALAVPVGYIDPTYRAKLMPKKELRSTVVWVE
eukprot:m51a1_g6934 hypothetical protein (182) ;mRNA; f:201233-201980